MQRHELTAWALDRALHGMTDEPGWRQHLPGKPMFDYGLSYLQSGRSPNIEGMAVAARLGFSRNKAAGERSEAFTMAENYVTLQEHALLANEFGSTIYTGWSMLAIAAVAKFAAELGQTNLANRAHFVLVSWLALARASLVVCPAGGLHAGVRYTTKGGGSSVIDERPQVGKKVVVICGHRSWGHGHGLEGAHQTVARVALGIEAPRPKNRVGEAGEQGDVARWPDRACRVLVEQLSRAGQEVQAAWNAGPRHLQPLLRSAPAYEVELIGYADGSRVFVHGHDEIEDIDEDRNSNTPAMALLAVYAGSKVVSLPEWPNPKDGDTRIRQAAMWSDIDRDPQGGWVLKHSHIGRDHVGQRWVSRAPDPAARPVWRIWSAPSRTNPGVFAWNVTVYSTAPGELPHEPPRPEEDPVVAPPPEPERPRRRRRTLLDWLVGLFS